MPEPRPAADAALSWLTHPVTCLALVLLLVNDHVLKAMWGTWWTGKLSDVAWLVVAPPLLATIVVGATGVLRVRRPSAPALSGVSIAVVALVFVVVKSTAAGATLASTALTALAGPSTVLRDLTDLLTLPALALAWAVALSTSSIEHPGPGTGFRSTARWLVVLPVAVLATAATSAPAPPATMSVVVAGDVVMVRHSGSSDWWYVSEDGSSWETVAEDGHEELIGEVEQKGRDAAEACVPASPSECFRATEAGLGVDRSEDGGHTWRADWSVPADVLARLESRYVPSGDMLSTTGVAILPTAEGFRVYAANRGDGLAVRDEHGTWQRLGFAYLPDAPPVVPLPGEPTTMTYPVPPVILGAVVAALLALVLSSRLPGASRRPGPRGEGTVIAWAVAVAGLAALMNHAWRVVEGQSIGVPLILIGDVVPGAVVGASTVLSVILTVVAARRRGANVAPLVVATGAGVALVLELGSPATLAAVVAAAVLGAGVAAVRRTTATRDDAGQSA